MNLTAMLGRRASLVAPELLGWRLASDTGGVRTEVELTEVEAYEEDDPASHSFRGETLRNRSMFAAPGTLYVYRSYGVHWCANVVTRRGSAVLLRAGLPTAGLDEMARRRGRTDHLTDGPGKLCQAMGIDGAHDGTPLLERSGVWLVPGPPPSSFVTTPRIGITRAVDAPWRFVAGAQG